MEEEDDEDENEDGLLQEGQERPQEEEEEEDEGGFGSRLHLQKGIPPKMDLLGKKNTFGDLFKVKDTV